MLVVFEGMTEQSTRQYYFQRFELLFQLSGGRRPQPSTTQSHFEFGVEFPETGKPCENRKSRHFERFK
jgi:hypothetical protein